MKREHSESETEDLYSGDDKDGEEGGGGVSRKRRRGIIEKRRRDRINNSLLELRRLVPAAFEKQGSAKLEKAEILQMTVDHLKSLHNKGLDSVGYDVNKYAMDYHNVGFRECAAEVARYMVTIEGLDIQDPLRLRLMSHLQCYSAQRELANKQSASSWSWGSTAAAQSPVAAATYPTNAAISGFQGHVMPHHATSHHNMSNLPSQHTATLGLEQSHGISAFSTPSSTTSDISTSSCSLMGSMLNTTRTAQPSIAPPPPPPSVSMPNTSSYTIPPTHANYHLNLNAHTFQVNHHTLPSMNLPQSSNLSSNSSNLSLSTNPASSNLPYSIQGTAGMKPYRPWGAEIAY